MPLNYRNEPPTNEVRAVWARDAIEAYARLTRGDSREHVVDDADGLHEILGDLLCDARHLAAAYNVDFDELIERSQSTWLEECEEEAEEAAADDTPVGRRVLPAARPEPTRIEPAQRRSTKMISTDTTPTESTQPLADLAERVVLAGDARIFLAPAHALCPGDVILLSEFRQVSAVRGERDTITITNGFGTDFVYPYDAWLLVFRPAHPAQRCSECHGTWFQGCQERCVFRYEQLEPARVIDALAEAGLLAPGYLNPYPV